MPFPPRGAVCHPGLAQLAILVRFGAQGSGFEGLSRWAEERRATTGFSRAPRDGPVRRHRDHLTYDQSTWSRQTDQNARENLIETPPTDQSVPRLRYPKSSANPSDPIKPEESKLMIHSSSTVQFAAR